MWITEINDKEGRLVGRIEHTADHAQAKESHEAYKAALQGLYRLCFFWEE